MSPRALVLVLMLFVAAGAPAGPAYAEGGSDVRAEVTPTGDAVDGVLLLGSWEQLIKEVPHPPAKASGSKWTCHFYTIASDVGDEGYTPGDPLTILDLATPSDFRFHYVFICTDETGKRVVDDRRWWDPANPAAVLNDPGAPVINLREAAVRIEALKPALKTSPPMERPQLVNVQTWFWLENMAAWEVRDRAVGIDGYTLRLTADNVELLIDPGDGTDEFGCTRDDAREWREGGPDRSKCGHRYFKKSAGQGDGTFHVTARLRYNNVSWTATGPGGTAYGEPLDEIISAPVDVPLTVRDAQAVIR